MNKSSLIFNHGNGILASGGRISNPIQTPNVDGSPSNPLSAASVDDLFSNPLYNSILTNKRRIPSPIQSPTVDSSPPTPLPPSPSIDAGLYMSPQASSVKRTDRRGEVCVLCMFYLCAFACLMAGHSGVTGMIHSGVTA